MRPALAFLAALAAFPAFAQTAPAPAAPQGPPPDLSPDSRGTGPFPAIKEADPALPDHVVYRPEDLGALGTLKLGVVVWGNGGCAADGASARHHLAQLASYGYLVIAPGTIRSGPGAPRARPARPAAPTPRASCRRSPPASRMSAPESTGRSPRMRARGAAITTASIPR